uniref:Uncharacterized protein n=1 Tax=Parascaris equorum TaxID=6256 RepID=A0A914RAF7_PAREQ
MNDSEPAKQCYETEVTAICPEVFVIFHNSLMTHYCAVNISPAAKCTRKGGKLFEKVYFINMIFHLVKLTTFSVGQIWTDMDRFTAHSA